MCFKVFSKVKTKISSFFLYAFYQTNVLLINWLKTEQRKHTDKSDMRAQMRCSKESKLSKEQKNAIKSYYKPFGKTSGIFFRSYYEKTGSFDVRYIPDDLYYTRIQFYYNDINAAHYVDHKGYYDTIFPNVKQPRTLAKRINGFWIVDGNYSKVEEVADAICQEKIVFVKKATDSCGGKGVIVLEPPMLSKKSIIRELMSEEDDIVIQAKIKQCKELNQINKTSVNSIRIMSMIEKSGKVVILSRSLRMGVGGSTIDNASSGGIMIGLSEDGKLSKFAISITGEKFNRHPDSGAEFINITIPHVDRIDEAVKICALGIPSFRIVAWDFSLDEDYLPVLIEANLYNAGLNVPQLTNGPLFGDQTEEYLSEALSPISLSKRLREKEKLF